jgi:hypothetical protein
MREARAYPASGNRRFGLADKGFCFTTWQWKRLDPTLAAWSLNCFPACEIIKVNGSKVST